MKKCPYGFSIALNFDQLSLLTRTYTITLLTCLTESVTILQASSYRVIIARGCKLLLYNNIFDFRMTRGARHSWFLEVDTVLVVLNIASNERAKNVYLLNRQ